MNTATHNPDVQEHIDVRSSEEYLSRRVLLGCEAERISLWSLLPRMSTIWAKELQSSSIQHWLEDRPEELKTELVVLVNRFLDSLAEPLSSSVEGRQLSESGSSKRQQELEWLSENRTQIEELAGSWIAVEGRELVASSPNFALVLAETRRRGITTPFLVFVPERVSGGTLNL